MIKRVLLMSLYVIALASFAVAIRLVWLAPLLWALAVIPGVLPKTRLIWRFAL